MATKDNAGLRFENYRAGTAGNAQIKRIAFTPGVIAAGDAYRLLKIHPGMVIHEVGATVHDAAGAGDTMHVGWAAGEADASDAALAAADGDVDYFIAAGPISAPAHLRSRNLSHHKPLTVARDGYLVAVFVGAVGAADGLDITFYVDFEFVGNL